MSTLKAEMDREIRRLMEQYGVEEIQKSVLRCASSSEGSSELMLSTSILEASFEATFLVDEEGIIVKVNSAAAKVFGYDSTKELVGQNCSILVGDPEHAARHDEYMLKFKERGRTSRALGVKRPEIARRKDDSTFPCRIGIQKLPNCSNLLVGFIQDTTDELKAIELAVEKRAAEALLFNMLPAEIAHRLKDDPTHIADHFAEATILFADIVGFTEKSNSLEPIQVVQFLNDVFSRFDARLDDYGLNKVKTIGDCYMVTSIPGCKDPPKTCAAVCHFAMDVIHEINNYNNDNNGGFPLSMRVGINTGPVVAGVVGTKRFLYDIWGDAVNVASRMESTGVPGRVQVTQAVVDAVSGTEFEFEKRGAVSVKGIGEMETYFLKGREKSKRRSHMAIRRSTIRTRSQMELLQALKQLET